MLTYEYKVDATPTQEASIEVAIQIVQFVRNKALLLWMETYETDRNDLQCLCATLARDFPFARVLNSQARQAAADRAWFAISRFYENCKQHKPGKKGYPKFQHNNRSVEYKNSGWKLEPDGRHLIFTDGCGIGRVRLIGNKGQQIETFPTRQIKRVRLVRRADGYYVQFGVKANRNVEHRLVGRQVGIDVGLKVYYTDSDGHTVENPRYYRKAEQKLKRLHRRLSRKKKGSENRKKARKALAKGYLQVQRQREDFARKQANALITSHDLIAYEHLQIHDMVRNRKLAKSIHDAGWGTFLQWVKYYGVLHNIPVIAVKPAYTSQQCSACGCMVKKSLSVRIHICPSCGVVLDRDRNAALNILTKALEEYYAGTDGQSGTSESMSSDNAWGKMAATVLPVMGVQQAVLWNQEPSAF